MRKCSYCGAEYPDDSVVCPVDQTKLAGEPIAASNIKRKIPTGLSIVSYCFFASGICYLGWLTVYLCHGRFLPLHLIIGVLNLFVSRGLRRCSPHWRICALVLLGLGFIETCFRIAHQFSHSAHFPGIAVYIPYSLSFLLLFWFVRVLTRPDIRILFYDEHESAA
jgi:hypothetical protein